LNVSCPAVSQIYNITALPLRYNVLILKSTPIVGRKLSLKILSENLSNNDDFPTDEFPIKRSLKS